MKKRNLLTIFSALFLILSMFAVAIYPAQSTEEVKCDKEEEKTTVSVSGNSVLEIMPDQAEIYIRIVTEAETAAEAQSKNSEKSNKVLKALEELGIDEDQIETTHYNLHARRIWDRVFQDYKVEKYVQTHGLKITIKELDEVGKVIDTAVDSGANGVDNIQFTLSEEKKQATLAQALGQATKNAKAKAEAIADALDLEIAGVKSIQDSTSQYYPWPVYRYDMAYSAEDGVEKAEPTQINPKEVSLTARVNIVFELN